MTTQFFRPHGSALVLLLTILLMPPFAQAQKETQIDEISEIRLTFERVRQESIVDSSLAEVADSFSEIGKDLLPAAGVGVRFVLSKKHQVSLSSDIGVGKDGVEFYFGIGEAF